MKNEVIGKIIKVTDLGLSCPTRVAVEYEVDGITYTIKESLKLNCETIKWSKIPIGVRKWPKIGPVKVGQEVVVEYENPKKGHIKGNDGWIIG